MINSYIKKPKKKKQKTKKKKRKMTKEENIPGEECEK